MNLIANYRGLRVDLCRLAEELLEKETLSLPDIVDILGQRPYPIKESVVEYMQELRARKDQEAEIAEQEKKAEEEHKAAMEATKFDPDADEKAEADDEGADASAAKDDGKAADGQEGKKDEDKEKKD